MLMYIQHFYVRVQFMCECCNVDLPNKMCVATQPASQKCTSMFNVRLFIIKLVISIHVLYIQAMGKSLHGKSACVQDFVFPFSSSMCTFSILNIILWALSPFSKVGSLAWSWQHTVYDYIERLHSLTVCKLISDCSFKTAEIKYVS